MPLQANSRRLCFIGDSFVNGRGDREGLGWVGRVCALTLRRGYDLTVYNLGVRGETSVDIAQRWPVEVRCRLPDPTEAGIVFSFGTNDTSLVNGQPRVALESSIAHTRQILQTAAQYYPVLMIGPPAIAETAHNLRNAELSLKFAILCLGLGIPYLASFKTTLESSVWQGEIAAGEGVHPNAAGYEELAQLVWNWEAWQSWFPPL